MNNDLNLYYILKEYDEIQQDDECYTNGEWLKVNPIFVGAKWKKISLCPIRRKFDISELLKG